MFSVENGPCGVPILFSLHFLTSVILQLIFLLQLSSGSQVQKSQHMSQIAEFLVEAKLGGGGIETKQIKKKKWLNQRHWKAGKVGSELQSYWMAAAYYY